MIQKEKSWLWYLTWPFAHRNFTSIGNTIYYPKGRKPSLKTILHEEIHLLQRKRVGAFKFYFLYLFALPFWKNPWRYKWEMEAYIHGSGLWPTDADKILKSYKYGWLR